MTKLTHFVGLDVHKDTIAAAVAHTGRAAADSLGTIVHDVPKLLKLLARIGPKRSLSVCYEAGPTGYELYRDLTKAGIPCEVIAPSRIPRTAGIRIKTDRRDALLLAECHRAGQLTPIYVPTEEQEAIRDLVRTRGDARDALTAARHQLSKFLLRHGRKYTGKTTWTKNHFYWLRHQQFELRAHELAHADMLRAVEFQTERIAQLEQQIAQVITGWSQLPLVQAIMALRGIDLLGAVTLVCEIGDFKRFATAKQLMSYLGLVPSLYSTADTRRLGPITKCGNVHARTALVEASHAYRFPPRVSLAIKKRQKGLDPRICDISWKAQNRLNRRYHSMMFRRKSVQVIAVATARELAGFVWAIARALEKQAAA